MTTRAEKAKQTRQNIINAALELLSQKPFSEISVQEITDKSGVAKGTFYTYFPTKEAVIFAMGEQFEKLPALKDNKAPILTQLNDYITEYVHHIVKDGVQLSRQWFRYVIEPGKEEVTNNKWDLDTRLLTQIFETAIKKGKLSKEIPVNEIVPLLNAQIYGFLIAWCITDTKVNPLDWTSKINEYLAKILKPYLLK